MKPFSTYPEDRGRLIALCAQIESSTLVDDTAVAADNLASLVRAILEDEAMAANAAEACGGPAFPQGLAVSDIAKMEGGLSVRDWFAGQAAAGLIAQSMGTALLSAPADGAAYAYQFADAMLAERAKAVQP